MKARFGYCAVFLISLLAAHWSFAQKNEQGTSVLWGIPNPNKGDDDQSVILYASKDSLIVSRTEQNNSREVRGIVLELFNTLNFRIEKSQRINVSAYKNDVVRLVYSDISEGMIRMFLSRQRKGERHISIMVHTLGLSFEEVSEGKELIRFYIPPPCSVYDWDMVCSESGNIFIVHPYGSENKTEGLRFHTIEGQMQRKDYKEFNLTSKSGTIEQLEIHSAPDAYAVASARILMEDAPEKFMIFLSGEDFSDALEFSLGQGKRILEITAHEHPQGFSVSGLFSNEKKRNRCAGVFTGLYQTNAQMVDQLRYFNLVDLKEKNPGITATDNLPEDLFIKDIYGVGDTDFLICEQARDENICISDPRTGFMRCNDYYYRNNILIFGIKNGQLAWKFSYPKRQTSVDDRGIYLSFCSFADEHGISLIFNENKKNLPVSRGKTMENVYKAECILLSLSTEGQFKTEPLYNNRDAEVILRPELHATLPNGEWIIYAEKGKGYKFGKLNR